MSSAAAGFGLMMSLIVAIGAQNILVLKQGIRRQHVGLVVALCAASDAILIGAGVAGLGAAVEAVPELLVAARYGGAAFLLAYAALSARRALQAPAGSGPLEEREPLASVAAGRRPGAVATVERAPTASTVALTTLALTWLNPHVYLDTVFLAGSVAATHGAGRWLFALGGAAASLTWFLALGLGARWLAPVLRSPGAWRALDGLVAVMMVAIAWSLVAS